MDVQLQLEKCTLLNVPFCCPHNFQPGGPSVTLTRPNLTKSIYGVEIHTQSHDYLNPDG